MDDVPLLVDTGIESSSTDIVVEKAVPVTIVTGYLGSGKSTLLKYLTEYNAGKKMAIILNEFGDTADIERSLTVTQDNTEVEEWLELDNGCLCCTAKDAGVTAIENLMKRKGKFDYILLETTGIADPAPIASMFWLDEALNSNLKLDGIVTVVDGVNIIQSIETGETARVQLACADVVLVNKCDLLNVDQLEAVESAIKKINGVARIIRTEFGRTDAHELLDLEAYSTLRHDAFITSTPGAKHDTDITTVTIPLQIETQTDFQNFERKLQLLLWEDTFQGYELETHRVKARICYNNGVRIIQGVRQIYDIIEPEASRGTQQTNDSKIVFIGRGFSDAKDALVKYFI